MKRGTKLLYKKIFAGLLGGGMLFMPNWSYALPSGGQVVTNNGTITAGGKVMDITGSGNVAIDWNSFNIAADEIVNFKNMQAVLNYVSGGRKSEIFGKLNGAGVNVFLVNPNGILFGKTAQVNVGQLTASTRSLEKAALNSFNGSLSPLDAGGAANVKADIINLGKLKAGKLVLEGNNLSIIGADSLEVADKSKITLRAGENINIGYEVTDKTTIDVGDGKGNTHQVSDYGKGGGDKASDVLSAASVTDLKGSAKSINDAMLVHDVYELQAIDRNTGTINGSSYALKLASYHCVEFGDNVRVGWDAIIMDTDFHRMKNRETGTFTKGYAPVLIGRNCWIGCRCTILKGTKLPAYCTLAAGTTIGKKIDGEGYKIISNTSELKIVKENYYRELGNDAIVYPVDSIIIDKLKHR